MEAGRREVFRQMLRERRVAMLREARIESGGGDVAAVPDDLDIAAAETDREIHLRLQDRDRRLLHQIDEALLRIEEGTFGECVACGVEIDERRLMARPMATHCIDCKTEIEKLEGRRRAF